MVRLTRTTMTLFLGCLIMFGGSASAGGGREDDPGRMVAADSDGIVSAVVPDQVCEKARGRSGERGPCAAQAGVTSGAIVGGEALRDEARFPENTPACAACFTDWATAVGLEK